MRVHGTRTIALMTAATLVLMSAGWPVTGEASSPAAQTEAPSSADENPAALSLYQSYMSTLHKQFSIDDADTDIVIAGAAFTAQEGGAAPAVGAADRGDTAVLTPAAGYVEWTVTVPQDGLYWLSASYRCAPGNSADPTRRLALDGEQPFSECGTLTFPRLWKEAADRWQQDERGNDIPPETIELFQWADWIFADNTGLTTDPFRLYLTKGTHTLRLEAVDGALLIDTLTLKAPTQPPAYRELAAAYAAAGYTSAPATVQRAFEAEQMAWRNTAVVTPKQDRTSGATTPYDPVKIRLNIMGGSNWAQPGQTVAWTIEAPEDGLYCITLRERQNIVSGVVASRRVAVDGRVLCSELEAVPFRYDLGWRMTTFTAADGQPLEIYLTKGRHELTMEVTLGAMAQTLGEVQEAVLALNNAYRRIVMLTGASPDANRDYKLPKVLPDVMELFDETAAQLEEVAQTLERSADTAGANNTILGTLSRQLSRFAEHPDEVTKRLSSFKTNIGSLAAWVLNTTSQPLEIDKIYLHGKGAALPKADESFFAKLSNGIQSFLGSFYEDYNSVGDTAGARETIRVWVQTGRDQAEILRSLVTNDFTPRYKTGVELKLVQGQLLMATVSGRGPDVALQAAASDPVNYAARGAAVDLSAMPGYEGVKARFRESAMLPYAYNGGTYALPETQSFFMLFYRRDILEELGLRVPDTWDEAIAMVADLHKQNLAFGIPVANSPSVTLNNMLSYGMFLYQNGGSFFTGDGVRSGLDSENAVQAFRQWTDLFVNYSLPVSYDAANRFRTGEMPALVADFTFYNTLSVFAPEIRGLWGFAPVPGTVRADGKTDRSVPGTGSACLLLSTSRRQAAAWQFMDWWTSADIQAKYGREMENRLGISARYPTANIEAFAQLPWPAADREELASQWPWVKGIPEVPGGYFTGRHLENAFRRVINKNEDPRETLLDVVKTIDEEIAYKRREFGLSE